ncbi:MAG: hypothetical protein IJ282_04075 [Lachnospiraceae bacterium]|nr:hypothetical protein [Lachnospiraceae bacterium]
MKGKEKCKALKEIRRQIAEANDIEFVVSECKHQGDCLGTCPKCESELRYLERELVIRQNLGKAVAVVGLSVGVCATMTACDTSDILKNPFGQEEVAGMMADPDTYELDGDVALPNPDEPLATKDSCEIENATEISGDIEMVGEIVAPETTAPETEWEIAGDISPAPWEEPTEGTPNE